VPDGVAITDEVVTRIAGHDRPAFGVGLKRLALTVQQDVVGLKIEIHVLAFAALLDGGDSCLGGSETDQRRFQHSSDFNPNVKLMATCYGNHSKKNCLITHFLLAGRRKVILASVCLAGIVARPSPIEH